MINDAEDPYTETIDDLKNTVQRREAFCNEVQHNLNLFSTSYFNYSQQLFQLSVETTNSLKKKQYRDVLLQPITDWVFEALANSKMMDRFSQMIKVNVVCPITELVDSYKKEADAIFLQFSELQKTHQREESEYNAEYSKYIKHCQNMEALYIKNEKSPGKFQHEFDRLRAQCTQIETDTAAACDKFRKLTYSHQIAFESLIVRFEKNERKFFDGFSKAMVKLAELLLSFEEQYKHFHSTLSTKLESLTIPESDYRERMAEYSEQIIKNYAVPDAPSFNIFDMLSPETVFQEDLTSKFMTVKTAIQNNSIDLQPGEIVKVVKPIGQTFRIENLQGIRAQVPKSALEANTDFEPKLYKVVEDFESDDFVVKANQYVAVFSNDGENATCKNVMNVKGVMPFSNLQPQS